MINRDLSLARRDPGGNEARASGVEVCTSVTFEC